MKAICKQFEFLVPLRALTPLIFDPDGNELVPGLKKQTYEQTTNAYPSWGARSQLSGEALNNYTANWEKNIRALIPTVWVADNIIENGSCATKASVTTNNIDPGILKGKGRKDVNGNDVIIGAPQFSNAIGLDDSVNYKVDTAGGSNLDSIGDQKGWIYFENLHVDLYDGKEKQMYSNGAVTHDYLNYKNKDGKWVPRNVYFAPLTTQPPKVEPVKTEGAE